jgi:hypothetical protein
MLRRTPLKRSRPKPWFRAEEDKVAAEERAYVLKRDGGCIAPQGGAETPCWGRLTLDHVKDDPRMGDRAPSDRRHLVSVCQGHSEDGRKAGYQWNTANREAERDYLRRVEG